MKKLSYLAMILCAFLFVSCSGDSKEDAAEDAASEAEQAADDEMLSY